MLNQWKRLRNHQLQKAQIQKGGNHIYIVWFWPHDMEILGTAYWTNSPGCGIWDAMTLKWLYCKCWYWWPVFNCCCSIKFNTITWIIFDKFTQRSKALTRQHLIFGFRLFVDKTQCQITFRFKLSGTIRNPIWRHCHGNTMNTLFITTNSCQGFVCTNSVKMLCWLLKQISIYLNFPQRHRFDVY